MKTVVDLVSKYKLDGVDFEYVSSPPLSETISDHS